MDAALHDPASISACSDEDAFNTENARIYFGPLRTPERKFAAVEDNLAEPLTTDTVPPPDPTPTAEDNDITVDEDNDTDDNDDASRVEELVGGAEDGGHDGQDDEIPFSVDYVDDEPSSALALRISSAMGNPSPPPSSTRPTTTLEPTEPTAVEASPEDRPTDVDLQVSNIVESPSESQSPSPSPPKDDQAMDVDAVLPTTPSAQPDLINFDSLTPLRLPSDVTSSAKEQFAPDSAVSAVDALLLYSPSPDPVTSTLDQDDATSASEWNPSEGILIAVEDAGAQASIPRILSPGPSNNGPVSETSPLSPPPPSPPSQPLRRSPRKSVALATAALSTPQGPITPRRSTSGPPMKKKLKVDSAPEETQDESDVPVDSNNTLLPIQQMPTNNMTPRGKERRRSKSPLVFSREARSLSPETNNLLSELIPSFTDKSPLELNAEPVETEEPSETAISAQGMQTFSVFSAPAADLPSTPKRSTSPIRSLDTPSPSKFRFQVSVPQNVPETPARRITIERALETGQISPLKASQLGYAPGATGAAANTSIPQTPARRVLVTDKDAPGRSSAVKRTPAPPSAMKQPTRFGTPTRSESQEPRMQASNAASTGTSRSGSAVPSFARATIASSASAGRNLASSSSNAGRTSRLPYPLVGAEKAPNTTSSSKEGEQASSSDSAPAKSNLKQPTSRIPRIGAKPYARPAIAVKTAVARQAPVPPPAPPPPAPKQPVTLRKVDLSKPSTTKMVNGTTSRAAPSTSTSTAVKGVVKEITTLRTAPASSSSNAAASSAAPSSIKRKRSPDLKPPPSPVKSRMPPRAAKTAAIAAVAAASRSSPVPSTRAVPAPQPGRARMIRKVVDPIQPPTPPPPPPPPVVAPESQPQPPPAEQAQPHPAPAPPPKPPSPPLTQARAQTPQPVFTPPQPEFDDLESPMKEDEAGAEDAPPPPAPKPRRRASLIPMPTPIVLPTIQIEPPPMETPPIETLPPQEIPLPSGVRRTTRQRKNVSMVDPIPEATTPRAASRRKSSQGPRFVFTDAYSEMSATALKLLTSANTMRNQHYLSARLELEVVKRDGLRPESPMVKIKTVAQRQADEQATKRSERAERRARRSGDSIMGSSDLEMDSDEEGYEGESPQLEEPEAHTRGAGEEEDYKTPDRAFRRMKLTEGGMRDVETNEKRRVKWDRGLFTVVFMDEIELGSRQVSKENRPEKGCLAPTVKALRLDTLGNLGSPDDLLPELSPQQITVKKFVYDGEVVEPVVVAAPPPPPVPKATRSRSRKSKS